MWIEQINIAGFGKLRDLAVQLCPNLNVILGANETGKSTLQDFLWAMMYGGEGAAGEVVSRYVPWGGREFGGHMVYHLDRDPGKGRVELRRDFRSATVDVTGGQGRGGARRSAGQEGYPGRDHLGLDLSVFLSTCLVRQDEVGALRGKADISHRLVHFAEMGDEEESVERAIQKIRRLAEQEIGSDSEGSLTAAMSRLEELIQERQEALFRRDEVRHDVLARQREQIRWERAQKRLDRILAAQRKAEALTLSRRIAQIKSLQGNLEELFETMQRGRRLPVLDRKGLQGIQGQRAGLRESLTRVEKEVEELEGKMQQILSRTEGLEVYLEMPSTARETLAGLRAHVVTGRERLGDEEQEIRERKRELELTQAEHKALKERYAPFENNFEQVLRDLRESQAAEGALEAQKKLLDESRRQAKELEGRMTSLQSDFRRHSITFGVLVCIVVLVAFVLGGALFDTTYEVVLSMTLVGALMGAAIFIMGFQPRKIREARTVTRRLTKSIPRLEEEIKESEAVIRLKKDAYLRAGVSSLDEFRLGFERYRTLDAKMAGIHEVLRRESARFRRTRAELSQSERKAILLLQRAGLLESGEDLTQEVIDAVNEKLEEVGDLRREKEVLEGLLSLKIRERDSMKGQIARLEEEARVILEDAGVDSLEAFEELCSQEDRVQKADREYQAKKERLSLLLGRSSLADLDQRLEELRRLIPPGMDAGDGEEEDEETKHETAEETKEDSRLSASADERERRKMIRHLQELIEEARRKVSLLDERIQHHAASTRHLADIEADIEEVGRRIVFLKGERAVLAEVVRSLQSLKEEYLMKRFAPQLESISTPILRRVTGGKYEDLRMDESLNLKVLPAGQDSLQDINQLSKGTRDQIYFTLRHAIGCILAESGEPLPLLLDDSFSSFDEERLQGAMQFLMEFSRSGQVILFTCHRHQAEVVEALCRDTGVEVRGAEVGPFRIATACHGASL